jgi:hypothetical protein
LVIVNSLSSAAALLPLLPLSLLTSAPVLLLVPQTLLPTPLSNSDGGLKRIGNEFQMIYIESNSIQRWGLGIYLGADLNMDLGQCLHNRTHTWI